MRLAVVAMLSPEIHVKLSPLAEDVFDLYAKVGEAVVLAEKDLEAGLVKLRDRHKNGSDLEARFREIVSNLLSAETRAHSKVDFIEDSQLCDLVVTGSANRIR